MNLFILIHFFCCMCVCHLLFRLLSFAYCYCWLFNRFVPFLISQIRASVYNFDIIFSAKKRCCIKCTKFWIYSNVRTQEKLQFSLLRRLYRINYSTITTAAVFIRLFSIVLFFFSESLSWRWRWRWRCWWWWWDNFSNIKFNFSCY